MANKDIDKLEFTPGELAIKEKYKTNFAPIEPSQRLKELTLTRMLAQAAVAPESGDPSRVRERHSWSSKFAQRYLPLVAVFALAVLGLFIFRLNNQQFPLFSKQKVRVEQGQEGGQGQLERGGDAAQATLAAQVPGQERAGVAKAAPVPEAGAELLGAGGGVPLSAEAGEPELASLDLAPEGAQSTESSFAALARAPGADAAPAAGEALGSSEEGVELLPDAGDTAADTAVPPAGALLPPAGLAQARPLAPEPPLTELISAAELEPALDLVYGEISKTYPDFWPQNTSLPAQINLNYSNTDCNLVHDKEQQEALTSAFRQSLSNKVKRPIVLNTFTSTQAAAPLISESSAATGRGNSIDVIQASYFPDRQVLNMCLQLSWEDTAAQYNNRTNSDILYLELQRTPRGWSVATPPEGQQGQQGGKTAPGSQGN